MDASRLDKELYNRTKRLRIAQAVLVGVILIGLGFLVVSNFRLTTANNKLQAQNATLIKEQQSTLDTLTKLGQQRSQQINSLQNHIDCIVSLFSQPNRLNLTITNITGCQLTSSTTGVTSTSSPPKVTQAPAPMPQSQPSQSSSSPPSSPVSSPPSQPTSTSRPSVVKQVLNFLGL